VEQKTGKDSYTTSLCFMCCKAVMLEISYNMSKGKVKCETNGSKQEHTKKK